MRVIGGAAVFLTAVCAAPAHAVPICAGVRSPTVQQAFQCGVSNYLVEGPYRDPGAAADWFLRAAKAGYAPAANNLGQMYIEGDGVPQSDRDGFVWLSRAAEGGYPKAMYGLALLYEAGRGTSLDHAKAAVWYARAAERGHAQAQNNLGNMYRYGYGVPIDVRKAAELYRASASEGNAVAAYNLGWMHYQGAGTPADLVEAYTWFSVARSLGAPSLSVLALAAIYEIDGFLAPEDLVHIETRLRALQAHWR